MSMYYVTKNYTFHLKYSSFGGDFEDETAAEEEILVKPLFNQYSKTHKITIHQGNNSR